MLCQMYKKNITITNYGHYKNTGQSPKVEVGAGHINLESCSGRGPA